MDYYHDVYLRRLNRYGMDYQSRLQGQRERVFEDLLTKSIYRVDFLYDDETVPGLLERYKQDDTKTLQYLLTRVDMNIPAGTILFIPDKDAVEVPYMIYYLENIEASGYNRYIVLRLTHTISWTDRDGNACKALGYFYGQEDNMLKDELKSRSRSNFVYDEDMKSNFFITPINAHINKEDYFEIVEYDMKGLEMRRGYRVTGFDYASSKGVEYVTVDPVYLHTDNSNISESSEDAPVADDDNAPENYWINGGWR